MSKETPGGNSEPPVPQSGSDQVVSGLKEAWSGTKEDAKATKESVGKAKDALKGLLTGDANIVDAAVAVKGAIDSVKGLSGKISASAMMPVMKALGAFKGQAFLPAGKQMDPVMGIDVHMVTIPPSPLPVPMPHPYIGILFNAKDWVSCLLNTFKKDALDLLPAPPEPEEGVEPEKGIVASVAANKEAIAGMAMGLLGMSASVKFGDAVPRAVTGTPVKNIPHIPMGAGFHAAFVAAVAKNHGKAFLGSLFVSADGDPMTGAFHLNYDCWDIGIVDLFKARRAGAIKEPPPAEVLAQLYVPSGTILPIPWGRPVLVNSIPTPINPMAILDKLFNAGLGKLKKAGRAAVQKGLNALNGKVGCGILTAASKAAGTGESHPVDVASGHFYTDNIDFSLPGPIPLSFERTWYSYSEYKGPLGHGWHHTYDMALAIDEETQTAILRMSDGRVAHFELPVAGAEIYNRPEKLTFYLHEDGYYYITDVKGLIYRFSIHKHRNPFNNTETHLLQSIANRNGFAIRFQYDNNSLLKQITDSAGRILTVNNDNHGRIINIQAPDPTFGGRTTFAITNYTYTDEGDMEKHADALNQPMFFYYENHLMVKEIWRNGCNWHFRYDKTLGSDAKCIEVWGDGDLLHYKFDYANPEHTIVFDSLGHKKTFYHKNGIVTKYIDPNNGIWQFSYNNYNELESEVDTLGNEFSYILDEWGNVVSEIDPGGGYSKREYNTPSFPFLQTGMIDAAGGRWKSEYDEMGNLISRSNPLGATTRFNYENGLLTRIINAAGAVTSLKYDNQQNIIEVKRHDDTTTEYLYDLLGNCIITTNPNGLKQKCKYDLKGRSEYVNDFDGNTIYLEYDKLNNIIHYRDKLKDVTYNYDRLGLLVSRTEADKTVIYKYNTEGQLCKVINEDGLAYSFILDATGKIIKEIGFDNITRSFQRNAVGWITKVERPDQKFTEYHYDACGRAIQVLYSDGKRESYNYRQDGKLSKAINESGTVEFERDVVGNITRETINGHWVSTEYDVLNNKVGTTSSLGADIKSGYNKMGDILEMQAGGWISKFEYDKLGLETARFLPGDVVNRWQRDGIGRHIMQEVSRRVGNGVNTYRSKRYQWNVNLQLKQIKDETGTTRFEYDSRNNLMKTVFPNGESQLRNLDAVGNLFQTNDSKDREYATGGQLRKANEWEYEYDSEGNLIQKAKKTSSLRTSLPEIWKYEWNDAGLLTKVIRPDNEEVTFTYDALSRRLSKQYKNTITKFIWDVSVPLHEWKEHVATGEKLSDLSVEKNGAITWVFDADSFALAAKLKGDIEYSVVTDHLGTPVQMYKDDGTLFWQCELDSFGKLHLERGDLGSCPFRYKGQYEDAETGLYYNRFRYYAPEEGLFISQDPIGLLGGNNLYSYVYDTNTVTDILGLEPVPEGYTRRSPTPGDTTVQSERAARREAMRREGIPTSQSYQPVVKDDPTDTRKGPDGKRLPPSERFKVVDIQQGGKKSGGATSVGQLSAHPAGHVFHDSGEFELPHFHDAKGAHICHGNS